MANLRKWSSSASGNSSVAGGSNTINFAEGQSPGSVNNSAREMMAQIRTIYAPDEWGWVEFSATASVASQTTFKLVGDQTTAWTGNRRVKLKSGSSTRYGTIVSSSFTTETTVTLAVDSGSLSASHSLAALSVVSGNHVPANYATSNSVSAAIATSAAAVNAAQLGKQTIWIPAIAMVSRTTNGPSSGTVETTTNKVMIKTLDFDTTTQEFAQFAIQMPKSWNEGTLVCQFVWSHPATTTNFGVVWAIEAMALADNDAADTAFGTAVTATDTGGTTNNIYISPETSAMTVAGSPGNEEYIVFQVKRNPSDGSDTMAVDARLHGVKIHYTTSAATDA